MFTVADTILVLIKTVDAAAPPLPDELIVTSPVPPVGDIVTLVPAIILDTPLTPPDTVVKLKAPLPLVVST